MTWISYKIQMSLNEVKEDQEWRHSLMTTSISNESSDAQERPRCGNKALRFYADVPSDEDKDGKMDDEYEDGNDRKVASV